VGQEECPLLPTENLPLFRINSKRIKKDHSHWKQGHSDSLPLLTSNKRINWESDFGVFEEQMADIGQVDMGEMMRRYDKEEVVRMMKEIMENNEMMLKLQKQIGELQMAEKEEKKRQVEYRRKEREQEEIDRWMEEYRKRNEKEREEREEKKRVEEEWRRIESMRKREEKRAEKEWRYQKIRERKREENRQKAMEERKCFACGRFGHMAYSCRNVGEEEPTQVSSNGFEVLKVRVM